VHTVTLAHRTDWQGFRHAARALVQAGVLPSQVQWCTAQDADIDLFAQAADGACLPLAAGNSAPACSAARAAEDGAAAGAEAYPAGAHGVGAEGSAGHLPAPGVAALHVPAAFVRLCQRLVLHRDPARFALMYRLLWRLAHEPALRHDPLDADRLQAQHMARAVARDLHKMHAFVRFRPVTEADDQTLQVAWFEPRHYIAEAAAPFFVRRFTQLRWAILTPDASVRWDGARLHLGPGAQRADAPPPDAGEALWLTYYRHIFNPARLKTAAMHREMPRHYWRNLPEAALIGELVQGAASRSARMVEAAPTTPRRRIAAPGTAPPRRPS